MRINSWLGFAVFASCLAGAIIAGALGQTELAAGLGVAVVAAMTGQAFGRSGERRTTAAPAPAGDDEDTKPGRR